jgi:multidrug efflux pump subunit AcrB
MKLAMQLPIEKIRGGINKVGRYGVIIFLILVVGVYAFMLLRINSLNNMQPTQDAVNSQYNPIRSAHIDKTIVKQLQSLQDNSVNVKSLFNQARNNPFQ